MSSMNLEEIAPTRTLPVSTESGRVDAVTDSVRNCDGFRVVSTEGYVGTVEMIVYGVDRQPAGIAVRTGLFARQLLLVAIEDVTAAFPVRNTIVLDGGWRLRATGVVEDEDLIESP